MKISEIIKGLQKTLDEHGDLECYYASDEEGNAYHKVNYESGIMFKFRNENEYYQVLYSQDDLDDIEQDCEDEDFDENDFEKVCMIN